MHSSHKEQLLLYQQKPKHINRSLGLFFQRVSKGISILNSLKRKIGIFDIQNFITKDMTPAEYLPFIEHKLSSLSSCSLYVQAKSLFLYDFMIIGLMEFLLCLILFSGPIFQNYLTKSYLRAQSHQTHLDIILLTVFLLVVQISGSLISSHQTWLNNKMQVRLRMFLQQALYQKSMKIKKHNKEKEESELVNLITIDVTNILNFSNSFHATWGAIFKLVLGMVLLYVQLEYSVIVGLVVGVVLVGINFKVAKLIGLNYHHLLLHKDRRITLIQDILAGIKQIKYLHWESLLIDKVRPIRKKELASLRNIKKLDGICVYLWAITNVCISAITFLVYKYVSGKSLKDQNIFVTINLFDILVFPLNALPWTALGVRMGRVSLDRVQEYIQRQQVNSITTLPHDQPLSISIHQTTLQWAQDTPFLLSIDRLDITKGSINLAIGGVGMGKTLFIKSLLGETISKGSIQVYAPQGLSYVSEKTWLMNESVRNNILIGSQEDLPKMQACLSICELASELNLDQQVGANGALLSGGQRARLCLARALYHSPSLLLLDDVFSSMDIQVAQQIYTNLKIYLPNSTLVMVLSNLNIMTTMSMNDPRLRILLFHNNTISTDANEIQQYLKIQDKEHDIDMINRSLVDPPLDPAIMKSIQHQVGEAILIDSPDEPDYEDDSSIFVSQILSTESIVNEHDYHNQGSIAQGVIAYFYRKQGCLFYFMLACLLLQQMATNFYNIWLKGIQQGHLIFKINDFGTTMAVIVITILVLSIFRSVSFFVSNLRSTRLIFEELLDHVMYARLSFFEETAPGRILNRFSADTQAIDDGIPFQTNIFIKNLLTLMGSIVVILLQIPMLIILAILIFIMFLWLAKKYRKISRELKRIDSNFSSQFLSLVDETGQGIDTIRSLNKQSFFMDKFQRRVNNQITSNYVNDCLQVWFQLRLNLISILFTAAVAGYALAQQLLQFPDSLFIDGYSLQLALLYSLQISNHFRDLFVSMVNVEREFISLERIHQFVLLDKEQLMTYQQQIQSQGAGVPLIEFRGVSLEYRPGIPALDEISFSIWAGQKVCLVGRTGSGKTSILNTLFRLYDISQGQILFQGQNISSLAVDSLRQMMDVIPQHGFLFKGSLKDNLDPGSYLSEGIVQQQIDYLLHKLSAQGLSQDMAFLRLDFEVESGGDNLSNGQKQLVNLLRVLLRHSQVVCLDEATSNLDNYSDQIVNSLIEDSAHRTFLYITHKVHNIQHFDIIHVIKDGRILQSGTYSQLQHSCPYFKELAKEYQEEI